MDLFLEGENMKVVDSKSPEGIRSNKEKHQIIEKHEKKQGTFRKVSRYFGNFYSYCYQKDKKITIAFTIFSIAAWIDECRLFLENKGLLWIVYSMFIKLKP